MKQLREMTEPELRGYFQSLGELMESVMPGADNPRGRSLFVLLVFDDPGLAQYVSNAERADVIQSLREAADRLARGEDLRRQRGA